MCYKLIAVVILLWIIGHFRAFLKRRKIMFWQIFWDGRNFCQNFMPKKNLCTFLSPVAISWIGLELMKIFKNGIVTFSFRHHCTAQRALNRGCSYSTCQPSPYGQARVASPYVLRWKSFFYHMFFLGWTEISEGSLLLHRIFWCETI